jgi:hypothetical protein
MKFSYPYGTTDQLLEHIAVASPSAVSVSRRYHLEQGNADVVKRIDAARLAARINKLIVKQQLQQA